MRHILLAQPVTAASLGMLEAASSALLVAVAGFLDGSAACGLRAASGAIDLAPVAAAADDDLGAAAMAHEESAGGFHWRFPSRQ
jgi:predicted nicotinamide N-methyase